MRFRDWNGRPGPLVSTSASALVLTLAFAGCSPDAPIPGDVVPRVPVSGTVTFEGGPLAEGTIMFEPDGETKGGQAIGEIHDGKFTLDRTAGPSPGKNKVRISSRLAPKLKEGESPGGMPKLKPESVPAKYNAKTVLDADVSDGKTFEFALKK